jgi:hypothetical protein
MGLLSTLFTLPLAPLRGVVAIGEIVLEQAEAELRSPEVIQRELEALEADYEAGRITEEELREAEQQILDRLTA